MTKREPEQWQIPGYADGLTDAVRRLHLAERRKPTDDDRPPPSTFPMTRAARYALKTGRKGWP